MRWSPYPATFTTSCRLERGRTEALKKLIFFDKNATNVVQDRPDDE
jgi:hypothetical protein